MGYNTQEYEKKVDFVDKNFLLISLEENKAKKIAEVINNDTARKILDHLAKKDCTETELSKDLSIAISTVHYNIKQLQEANLVIVEEFHYSQKGKEVNHYKLANKYIIITPKNEDPKFLTALRKILPLIVITAVVSVIMGLFEKFSNATYEATAPRTMPLMAAAPQGGIAANIAQETTRPILQSNPIAFFIIGAVTVIIIYFLYEFVKK